MNTRGRIALTIIGTVGLAVLLCLASLQLPGFGNYPGPYGDVINSLAPYQRHVANAVTAVIFDYRGLDTMGEEFILFAAISGLVLLMREKSAERGDAPLPTGNRSLFPRSDAVQWTSLLMIGGITLFGIYIVLHGQLTPGGGFQGGAILAAALLLVYLGNDYTLFRKTNPIWMLELGEALGAVGYVLIGLGGMIAGGTFLENFISLGERGRLISGGTIPLISLAVGLEVAAGFALLSREFLKETRVSGEEK